MLPPSAPSSRPSSPSDFDPVWGLAGLRAEPAWLEFLRTGFQGGPVMEFAGGLRRYYLQSVETGLFALALPGELAFFSGRLARLGLSLPGGASAHDAERAAAALGDRGVRVPGSGWRLRAVGRRGHVFFVVDEAAGDEPLLPLDWLACCEIDGEEAERPWWIGRTRFACERQWRLERRGGAPAWWGAIDWSRYERRALGWKLIDAPPLSVAISDPASRPG